MDGITLGIRPEDIVLGSDREKIADSTKTIEATTDVLEPMGDEIFVYLLLDGEVDIDIEDSSTGGQLLMSVDPATDIEPDQHVKVSLDRSKIHLFDTETGNTIRHGLERHAHPTESDGTQSTSASASTSMSDDDTH